MSSKSYKLKTIREILYKDKTDNDLLSHGISMRDIKTIDSVWEHIKPVIRLKVPKLK